MQSSGLVAPVLLAGLVACNEGGSSGGNGFLPITAVAEGTQGCGALAPEPFQATELGFSGGLGEMRGLGRMAGVAGTMTAYATFHDGSVRLLDFSTSPVTASTVVSAGTIAALLGIAGATLSGITILDADTLVVAEHRTNTLVEISISDPTDVAVFAGAPGMGGFQDGTGSMIEFRFEAPVTLLAALPRSVYVCDTGNHAIRRVDRASRAVLPVGFTIAGTGSPGFADGDLASAAFDTPSGMTLTCPGEMIVTESGTAGAGGHRVRLLHLTGITRGRFTGSATTLAGNGIPISFPGPAEQSALSGPIAPILGTDGTSTIVQWIDGASGVLRRYDFASGASGCPLDPTCMGFTLPPGEAVSMIRLADDQLYVHTTNSRLQVRFFRIDP